MENVITKDMHLAAVLVSYGCKIVHVDHSNPKQQYFTFDQLPPFVFISDDMGFPIESTVDTLTDLKALYLSKRLFFPPTFVDCLRSMKAYLYLE
jgi:hypothetical protein